MSGHDCCRPIPRFQVRRLAAAAWGPTWVVWDAQREIPIDGFYFVKEVADEVAAGANGHDREGRDVYEVWGWADDRSRHLLDEMRQHGACS